MDAIIPIATYADGVSSSPSGSINGFNYSGAYINAYLDSTAKNVGYAYLNNIVGVFDGTYWKPINDSNKVLSGDFKVQVNASDIGGVAGNGLVYTNASAPFNTGYRLDIEFGVTSWSSPRTNYVNENMNSTNICAVRGMRLPTYNETQISSSNGVPSHSDYTWTSTPNSNDLNRYQKWLGTSHSHNYYTGNLRVRCVR